MRSLFFILVPAFLMAQGIERAVQIESLLSSNTQASSNHQLIAQDHTGKPLPFKGRVLESESMLFQADAIAKKYGSEIAKIPPPSPILQTDECLNSASVWFSIDLDEIKGPALFTLNNEILWDHLREIGVEGVYLSKLKKGGLERTGIGLDPIWGSGWDDLAITLQKKGVSLICDGLGNSTGLCPDFFLALKNVGDYPGLYHLIEVEKKDWKLLPPMTSSQLTTNIPWLSLQSLQKKGYVPEKFTPYVKESRWNATSPIECADGKVRRWIFLKTNQSDPVINWLNPSFAGSRIATADTLDSIYHLGQKVIRLSASMTPYAKETLSLWARKLGNFSLQETRCGIGELNSLNSDMIADIWTRPALLHALTCEDAESLKIIYRIFLESAIPIKRFQHALQPFDEFTCDWNEWLLYPKKKYQYYEEILTAEALRTRMMKEDVLTLGEERKTWPGYCAAALDIKDLEKRREDVLEAHILLAFFYAMQPGVFSFSLSDLLGTFSKESNLDPMQPNENTLYPCLPSQFLNQRSFAMQMRKILRVRRDLGIKNGELIDIPATKNRGVILLLHQLNGSSKQLLALNFSRQKVKETIELPSLRDTTAIDLMSHLAEKKPLKSSTYQIEIPSLSGKVILFQPKYFD